MEQQIKKRQASAIRRPAKKKGRINPGRLPKAAGAGGACPRRLRANGRIRVTAIWFPGGRNKRLPPPPSRRRGQGVITGLAARRPAALLRRGTLIRAALNQVPAAGDEWMNPSLNVLVAPLSFRRVGRDVPMFSHNTGTVEVINNQRAAICFQQEFLQKENGQKCGLFIK